MKDAGRAPAWGKTMNLYRLPDRPTPVGCLVGFLSLFPLTGSVLCFIGSWRAYSVEPPVQETGRKLLVWGLLALLPAIAGLGFSLHRILTVGKRSHFRIGDSLED